MAAQESGGGQKIVSKLEGQLRQQEKVAEKVPSQALSWKFIESTRGYIAWQKKKFDALQFQLQLLEEESKLVEVNIAEAEDRLQKMKIEAAKTLSYAPLSLDKIELILWRLLFRVFYKLCTIVSSRPILSKQWE